MAASAVIGTSISHARALVDWEQDAIPRLLKLEEVMPGLLQRKVVPKKKIAKRIVEQNDFLTLLGILKAKPIGVFVNFLQALADTFPKCETHRELVLKMRDSLERIYLSPDSEVHRAAIQEVITRAALEDQPSTPTQPEVQSSVREELPTAGEPDLTIVTDSGSSEVVSKDEESTSQTQATNNSDSCICTASSSPQPDSEVVSKDEESTSQMQAANFQTHATHSDSCTASSSVPQPDSASSEVVSQDEESASQMQATNATHSDTRTASSSVPQPASPDPCSSYIDPCRSWHFTREGGLFHCPAHGISGCIPTTAVPPGIDKFEVHMKVFMQGDFRLPDLVEPCTAVVEFSLTPSFEFIGDITIQIPHCAAVDGEVDSETFCLLKISKRHAPVLEVLEARYSNHYHVIAKLRHFCKIVGCRKIPLQRQRRWSRSDSTGISKKDLSRSTRDCLKKIRTLRDLVTQDSVTSPQSSPSLTGSFESSWEDQGPSPIPQTVVQSLATPMSSCHLARQEAVDIDRSTLLLNQQSSSEDAIFGSCNLYIVQCMRHQCPGRWETNFFLSSALPTGMLVLLQAVEKTCAEVKTKHLCKPTDSYLEFNPQHWNKDGWDVKATGTPKIGTQEVTHFSCYYSKEQMESLVNAGLYPARISYLVNHTDPLNPAPLECKIVVKGAEINGEPLYFMLTSPPQTLTTSKCSTDTRRLHTCQDLYHPESTICSAVCGSSSGTALPLDPQSEDHCRFIADISFQLTETDFQQLSGVLEMKQPELDRIVGSCGTDLPERIYQVLLSWMSRHYPNSDIKTLLAILQRLDISGIEPSSWNTESICSTIDCHISKNSIHCKAFIRAIALEIKQRWKFIGRFIGVSESDISAVTQEGFLENRLWEMSFQMLLKWQQQKAERATYGALLKAIYRVFEHDPSSVCSAWWFCRRHIAEYIMHSGI